MEMTDAEAIKQWREHNPWVRPSQELIDRIQRINNNHSNKLETFLEELGEAPV